MIRTSSSSLFDVKAADTFNILEIFTCQSLFTYFLILFAHHIGTQVVDGKINMTW